MDELEKLKKLLPHWKEHNEEHARTYKHWAEEMSSLGKTELSEALKAIQQETEKLRELFEEALRAVDR